MKTNARRLPAIEVKSFDRLLNIRPQLLPAIALGKDALAQRFGDKASIRLLCDLEDKLVHAFNL